MRFKNAHARFCSDKCRNYARRNLAKKHLPALITGTNRWVRWKLVRRGGRMTKVPLTVDGHAASSTDAATWASYADAAQSTVGDGLGFVLTGDGISCVDLDHVIVDGVMDPRAAEFLESLDAFYVETSPSGDGVHAWVTHGSPNGRKVYTLDNGLKVEWYSTGRYLTVTGKVIA
jgi:primase-polymerase (primpol)-like protein